MTHEKHGHLLQKLLRVISDVIGKSLVGLGRDFPLDYEGPERGPLWSLLPDAPASVGIGHVVPVNALRDHRVQCERAQIAVVEEVRNDVRGEVGPLFAVWIETGIRPEDVWGEFAGVDPVDVHLEVCRADFWQAHDVLLASDPAVGGDGGFEELGTLADVASVDLELELIWSEEDGDEVVVVVEANTQISYGPVNAGVAIIYARLPIVERAISPLQAATKAGTAVRASKDDNWYGFHRERGESTD